MDTLQNVFPDVAPEALERVLEICDQSVEAASEWLLENDWHDLMDEEAAQDDGDVEFVGERAAPNGGDEGANDTHIMNGGSNGHIAAVRRTQAAASDRQNGHSVAVAAAAATRNYIARALSGGSVVSPASNQSDQPGLTMAVSTGSAVAHLANGHYGGAHVAAGAAAGHRANHHQHDRLGRHHHHRDDVAYESAGDPDLDSEDGEGEGEEDEDDEDDEDDDDEDDEDGDGNPYYDSGDDSYYQGSLPQLTKRIKVTQDPKVTSIESSEYFWASFDGLVIPKTLIELLNTTLTKLAHSSVTLLNKSSKHITEADARKRLKSILNHADEAMPEQHVSSVDNRFRSGNFLSRILNASPSPATSEEQPHGGQKRKRVDEALSTPPQGFFAHFFSINDLDMVWRSILHAHLFNGRFGEIVEFHTAAAGGFSKRDFDELMHIYTSISSSSRPGAHGASQLSGLRCCLLLPCEASEDEIFRVGKHLHTLLKIQGSLYYRTLDVSLEEDATSNRENNPADLLNENGKLSEESFRRFARYRIKKEEVEAIDKNDKEAIGPDHFLAYQQQRKVDHCLQHLEKSAWVQRLSG